MNRDSNDRKEKIQVSLSVLGLVVSILSLFLPNINIFSFFFWENWKVIVFVATGLLSFTFVRLFISLVFYVWGRDRTKRKSFRSGMILFFILVFVLLRFLFMSHYQMRIDEIAGPSVKEKMNTKSPVDSARLALIDTLQSDKNLFSDTLTTEDKDSSKFLDIPFMMELVQGFSTHRQFYSDDILRIEPDSTFIILSDTLGPLNDQERGEFSRIYDFLKSRVQRLKKSRYGAVLNEDIRSMVSFNYRDMKALNFRDIEEAQEELKGEELETYLLWQRKYMGQWSPKIRITSADPDERLRDIAILEVSFYVESFDFLPETFDIRGRPHQRIPFNLEPKSGEQSFSVHGSNSFEFNSNGPNLSVELILKPMANRLYHGRWQGYIVLKTTKGMIRTPNIDFISYSDSESFFFQ